ncbi:hypothetical protein SOVF_177610, partial [Spinacia oleracea]
MDGGRLQEPDGGGKSAPGPNPADRPPTTDIPAVASLALNLSHEPSLPSTTTTGSQLSPASDTTAAGQILTQPLLDLPPPSALPVALPPPLIDPVANPPTTQLATDLSPQPTQIATPPPTNLIP